MTVNATSTGGFRLRLLGGAGLERDGSPLDGPAVQRHRLALLALLALSGSAPLTRDKVAGLLWPETDESQARRRLREALYVLRKTLGRESITSAGDELRLDTDAVEVDVLAVEEALEEGDLESAVERYTGSFLDGFHLPDAEEFERWAETTRSRLESAVCGALETLARAAMEDERAPSAVERWRRLVAIRPYSSRAALGLMESLVAAGDRGEALRHARHHADLLRKDLGVEPEPEIGELVRRLRETEGPEVAAPEPASRESGDTVRAGRTHGADDPIPSSGAGPLPFAHGDSGRTPRGRRTRAAMIAVLSLAAIALVFGIRHGSAPAESGEVIETVAVLPFTVRGGDRLAYLQAGVAELLGARLDGAGSFRTVDPRAVLGSMGDDSPPVDPADGRPVARRFGARSYVVGSVVEAGNGRLRFQADLYDLEGEREASVSTVATADSLLDAIDELARRLVASRYGDEGERLNRLAATTTTSLPALTAYLDGEAAFRNGRFDEALEAFREATRRDTTFALAWYRLAVAADWTLRPRLSIEATARSVRHAGRLPERDRLLIEAWRAQTRGNAGEAERLYHRVLETRPTDLEARLQLGEVLFHFGPRDGRPIGEARAMFEEVLEVDADHGGALLHLARIAAREGRTADVNRLVDRIAHRGPSDELTLEARALRAFARGDREETIRVLDDHREIDSDAILGSVWSVSYTGRPEAVAEMAEPLTSTWHSPDVRAVGHAIRATVEAGRGRWQAAGRELDAARRVDPDLALDVRGFLYALPFAPVDPDSVRTLRTRLRARLGGAPDPAAGPVVASAFVTAHESVRPIVDAYLLAVLDGGDPSVLRETARTLGEATLPEDPSDPSIPSLARDLARGLEARASAAEGRLDEALAALEKLEHGTPYERAFASPYFARSLERYLHARLLEETGRFEEALRLYDSFADYSLYDVALRAPAHLRRAEIRLAQGDERAASRHLRRFLELWEDADPALRPEVDRARRLLAELGG